MKDFHSDAMVYRASCPVCDSAQTEDYLDLPADSGEVRDYLVSYYSIFRSKGLGELPDWMSGARYVLAECRACNCTFQRYRLSERYAQELYSIWIRHRPLRLQVEDVEHYSREALRLTKLALGTTRASALNELRVLDYGMGRGGLALAFRGCGCTVYGFDFAEVRQSEANFGINVITEDEIGNHRYEIINTEQVFEHLPWPLDTARRLADALAPGGLLKISVPFNRTLERGDKRIRWNASRYGRHSPMPNAPLEHLQYYRRPSLDVLGAKLGLERVRVPRTDYIRHGKDWLGTGLLKNVGSAIAHDAFRNYYLFRRPLDRA